MLLTLTAKIQRTVKATPKTVHIDKLKDFVGTLPRCCQNTDATEVYLPAKQPLSVLSLPEASKQRKEYGQPPSFVLNGSLSINDGVTSSRLGPNKTLVKRSSGETLVDGQSKIV